LFRNPRTLSKSLLVSWSLKAAVGSSMIRIRACLLRALAISTHCVLQPRFFRPSHEHPPLFQLVSSFLPIDSFPFYLQAKFRTRHPANIDVLCHRQCLY
jgi:hypothetical protein